VPEEPAAPSGEGRALVVQNKGGGHGELGYHLCLTLADKYGLEVTMVHDGGPDAKTGKEPWDSYKNLEAAGVEIVWADLGAGMPSLTGEFEFVFDNWSKDADLAKPYVEAAKSWGVSNYVFVSSAGMYSGKGSLKESDDVKETGQRAVEKMLADQGLPWTSFRPQYIYGPYTNKRDYLDFFFNRAARNMPIPCPEGGEQGLCCTNAEDVAALLATPVANPAAVGEVFNCGTNEIVTYNKLIAMVGDCTGTKPEISYVDKDKAKELKFPFRPNPEGFYVDVSKAKKTLGWSPTHSLAEDLTEYYDGFKKLKLGEGEFAGP